MRWFASRGHRMEKMAKPNLKDLLLAPEPRTDNLTPPRPKPRMRPPPKLT